MSTGENMNKETKDLVERLETRANFIEGTHGGAVTAEIMRQAAARLTQLEEQNRELVEGLERCYEAQLYSHADHCKAFESARALIAKHPAEAENEKVSE